MTRYTLDLLEGLQQEIHDLDFEVDYSDTDSVSLASRSTKATSIELGNEANIDTKKSPTFVCETSSRSSGPEVKKLPFPQKVDFLGDRIENSALILECFNDMVLQENALIEASLAKLCEDLAASKGMNTFKIEKKCLFPVKYS